MNEIENRMIIVEETTTRILKILNEKLGGEEKKMAPKIISPPKKFCPKEKKMTKKIGKKMGKILP